MSMLKPKLNHSSVDRERRQFSAKHKVTRTLLFVFTYLVLLSVVSFALESETFRLLSLSDSNKMILVSKMPAKTKYMLDAATAKITVNGKPAEFSDLVQYSIIQVKFELRKGKKEGIDIDGVATEITMTPPQSP